MGEKKEGEVRFPGEIGTPRVCLRLSGDASKTQIIVVPRGHYSEFPRDAVNSTCLPYRSPIRRPWQREIGRGILEISRRPRRIALRDEKKVIFFLPR